MKKNRKQHKMLRDFYNYACTPQQLQKLRGGTGGEGEDSGGLTPPPPPKKTAAATSGS